MVGSPAPGFGYSNVGVPMGFPYIPNPIEKINSKLGAVSTSKKTANTEPEAPKCNQQTHLGNDMPVFALSVAIVLLKSQSQGQ